MLSLRLIAPNDYTVLEDGHPVGRIRLARERSHPVWLWTVTVTIPGGPVATGESDRHQPTVLAHEARKRCEEGPTNIFEADIEALATR